ncbi:MAG: diphosphomevalonate decarboxylase [Cryobacterium sp.]|nr:diphosphomevalonate decarboxylase [Cryobacterium sp.]
MENTGGVRSATARAHSNIALAKYWGKRDAALNIPAVSSISVTLDGLSTDTTVRFDESLGTDEFRLDGRLVPADHAQSRRVVAVLELIRERAGLASRASVTSANNFPTGAGLASSASGFAALVVAASAAAGLDLSARELSILARRGSASAARSLFGGFVELHAGIADDGSDSFAEQLLDGEAWPLEVVVAITDSAVKAVSSTAGMQSTSATSPFYPAWIESSEDTVREMREAVLARDFRAVGELTEHSCLALHSLMLTTRPALIYWNAATVATIHAVRALRADGVPVYFTIDAGPQVKALCRPEDSQAVGDALAAVRGVRHAIRTGLGRAASLDVPPTDSFHSAPTAGTS